MKLQQIPATIAEVYRYLESMPVFRKDGAKAANFKLKETEDLLAALGNPHRTLRCIHVAGTNGKGSTCALLAAVYQAAGYKTGLYTSPHVTEFPERIKIDGKMIPESAMLSFFHVHATALQHFEHTYFELATALAFWWFEQEKVDIAVIETGLGGRLDATNVVLPLLSVITSIGYDHTEILGPTLEHIAAEKAGIIKPGAPVVIGNLPEEADLVTRFHAAIHGSPVLEASALHAHWENGRITLLNGESPYECGLKSEPQPYNVAMTWLAVEKLQKSFPVTENQFREGIKKVQELTGLHGRFEKLHPEKEWYFDGGHNAEALAGAAETIKRLAGSRKPILIFSMMRDKVTKEALSPFFEFEEVWYHSMTSERAAKFADFATVAGHARHLDSLQTFKAIVNQNPDRCFFFLGSFYFYNTVRNWISES